MTRTSATGVPEAGFTLIELLVVLLLMGIMFGLVTLSVRSPKTRPLGEEAERLAATMNLAVDEARLTGQPLLLVVDTRSWRFFEPGPQGPEPVSDDRLPGGRFDPQIDGLAIDGGSGNNGEASTGLRYWVGQEPLDGFHGIALWHGNEQAQVRSDGLGNYQVGR